MGLNEGLDPSPELLDSAAEMGVGLMRADLSWDEVEPEPGTYDFSRIDDYVDDCEQRGMSVLFIFHGQNDHYDRPGTVPVPGNDLWAPYASFVEAAVERYADDDVLWELWNEPDIAWMSGSMTPNQFLTYAFGTIDVIRSSDPDATIVGPGAGYGLRSGGTTDGGENVLADNWGLQLLRLLDDHSEKFGYPTDAEGFFERINAWTGHQYTTSPPDNLTVEGKEFYELQREVLDAFGGEDVPFCEGERGFTANPDPGQAYAFVDNERRRADYYTRQCLWGVYKEPRGFTINYVNHSVYDCGKGIVGTPAETAISTMLEVLGDFEFAERRPTADDDVVVLRFTDGDSDRYAVWDRTGGSREGTVYIGCDRAIVHDNEGHSRTESGRHEGVSITIDGSPKYLVPLE